MRKFLMMFVAAVVSLTLVGCGETVIDDVSVTVEYVDYDGIILQTQEHEIGSDLSGLTAPLDPERIGYTFDGWSGTVPAILGEETVTLTATYTINHYTVEYVDYDGTILLTEGYDFGADLTGVTTPTDPVRVGYTFDSWSGTVPATMGTETVTLTAMYTINQQIVQYVDHDGTVLQIEDYDFGADLSGVTAPTDPVRDGYTFDSWSGTVPATMGTTSVTVTANYTINQYSISYSLDGGSNNMGNVSSYNIENKTITLLPARKTEATFLGWYDNVGLKGLLVTTIPRGSYENITLYARWAMNEYTIISTRVDSSYDPTDQLNLAVGETIMSASLGYHHSSVLTSEGRLFTWGSNWGTIMTDIPFQTQIHVPHEITTQFNLAVGETITSVSMGGDHSSAVTSEGRLFTWGSNTNGQLGDGTILNISTPTDITSQFNLAVGEIIISASLGTKHSLAVTSEGRVFTWGYNYHGQLGDGTTDDKHVPTEITDQFNFAIGETITSISLGAYHSSALTSEGRVFTWGYNSYGGLGIGTTVEKHVPTEITNQFNLAIGETITTITLGSHHSSALTSEGRVFTWGYNDSGQLGDGTFSRKLVPTDITNQFNLAVGEEIEVLSLGSIHSSALTSEGRVFVWGDNYFGQIGDETNIDRNTPTDITNQFKLVSETVTNISMGGIHSLAVTSDGRIFAWGDNEYGQLGDDDAPLDKNVPTDIQYYLNYIYVYDEVSVDFDTEISNEIVTYIGYTFAGWYTDSDLTHAYNGTLMPNYTLYALYIEN